MILEKWHSESAPWRFGFVSPLEQENGPMLVLYVRLRSKFSADTLSNLAVRVVEDSLTDEEALKDAMTGVDTVVSFLILFLSAPSRSPGRSSYSVSRHLFLCHKGMLRW